MSRAPAWAAVVVCGLLLSGCRGSAGPKAIVLDGTPRYPDAEGVVERVDVEHITLDGGRSYAVSKKLQSFSSQTMRTVPLLQRNHQYVQVGLDGHTMVWIAAVGAVLPTKPPIVYYTGTLERVSGGRAIFRDGTVLRLDKGVALPKLPAFVQAKLSPTRHAVTTVRLP